MGQNFESLQPGATNIKDKAVALESARTSGQQTEETRQKASGGIDIGNYLSNTESHVSNKFVDPTKISARGGYWTWEGVANRLNGHACVEEYDF